MPGTFYVLLSKPEDAPLNVLTQVFVKFHGYTAFDGQRAAKHAWGFLGEKLSGEDAARLQNEAKAQGLDTFVIDEKNLLELPESKTLHRARLDDAGVHYTMGTDPQEFSLPWDKVGLFGAVGLREETSFTKTIKEGPTAQQRAIGIGISMVTGIPINLGGKSQEVKKVVKTSEFYLYLDLFAKDLSARLHVDAQHFIFKDLGDKMQPSASANFKVLLGEIVRHVPAALKNRAVRMIQAGQPYASMGYDTRDDYEKECRWLLTLCRKPA